MELAHLETTIASVIEFSGIGLHSGAPANLRLRPALAGSGIVFRRTHLDNYEIAATGRNAAKVSYATSIMRQGVPISTTEHLLSALIGMGVDNVIIELDTLELPILDGSARPTGKHLTRWHPDPAAPAATSPHTESVEVRENGKFIAVYPGEGYSITYEIHFPTLSAVRPSPSIWPLEPMAPRSPPPAPLGFAKMRRCCRIWSIRGASEENAIILCPGEVQNGPLRFDDEFVRHKVLDLIGDLALAGHRILGRVAPSEPGTPCTLLWFPACSAIDLPGSWRNFPLRGAPW